MFLITVGKKSLFLMYDFSVDQAADVQRNVGTL